MSKVKALNKDFKPKIVPTIESSNKKLLDSIQYPVYICAYPKGVKVFIRSGHIRFENGDIVRNMNLKNNLSKVLEKSRKIKVTLECVVSSIPKVPNEEENLYGILSDLTGNVENLKFTITDIVFEHSPETLTFGARINSLKVLFRSEDVGKYHKIIEFAIASSKKEFENLILVYSIADAYSNFIIASPNSKYKFGSAEELFSKNGGIAEIDTKNLFSAELIEIQPKILELRNKNIYVAKYLKVKYEDTMFELELNSESVIVNSKIWENRENLINQKVLFSGALIPGYQYPKYRSFVRFEKFE